MSVHECAPRAAAEFAVVWNDVILRGVFPMKYSGTSKIEDILNLEVAQDFLWVCARAERINCACVWAFNCVSGLLSYCFTYTTFFFTQCGS